MTKKQNHSILFFLLSLVIITACNDVSPNPPLPPQEETPPSTKIPYWTLRDHTKNVFEHGSLVSFTKDSDSGIRVFFHDVYNWIGDAQNILDTTITLKDYRYILLDYTISDTSSCSVDKMKLFMDGEAIPFNLDTNQGSPQKHFRNTFDFPDFANDHVFKILFDADECRNINMTFNVSMSKEPGTCWMATDIQPEPEYRSSFPMGDLIFGLKPILWNTFGELIIPDTTYSHCILVKQGTPPDTLRLPLQFVEPSGHDIPTAYLSYYKSEKLTNFLGTDTIAQLSCALFYQKRLIPSAPDIRDQNHYAFSRTLQFSQRNITSPDREIKKIDSIKIQITSNKNFGFDYFIAKYKMKGIDIPYYQKLKSNNKSEDRDIQTISISPNDSITALIDSVSIFMAKINDAESYFTYKDLSYMNYNIPESFKDYLFTIDSTGNITKTFDRLTANLNENTAIKSYAIFNTTVESPVKETNSEEISSTPTEQ